MKELVFRGEDGKVLTTSLLVAEKFGKRHGDVLRSIESVISQTPENQSERNFALSEYQDASGKNNPMYVMTKDGFSILVMGFTGVSAMSFKWAFIDKFNEMENSIKNGEFDIPKTYSGALMLAAKQAEQLEKQEALLIEQAPKVDFYNAVTGSTDTIDMRTVATVLNCGVGRNKIFETLRNKKILDGKNKPYQSYIDRGYFRTIESSYTKPDGSECINIKTVVFQKGLDFIRKTLKAN